jgi:hypothetical protein
MREAPSIVEFGTTGMRAEERPLLEGVAQQMEKISAYCSKLWSV